MIARERLLLSVSPVRMSISKTSLIAPISPESEHVLEHVPFDSTPAFAL